MQDTPIRVGVFTHLDNADAAVQNLVDAGFTHENIAVICSDHDTHHERLEHYRQSEPSERSEASAIAGGAIGATLGGLAAVGGGLATGGIGLVAAGLASSRGDARRGLQQRAYSLNGRKVESGERTVARDDLVGGRYVVLQKGRKHYALLVAGQA